MRLQSSSEVQAFFKTYYVPNNAVLAMVGDFDSKQAKAMVEKYFGGIPAVKVPPLPDLTEPRQEKEKLASRKGSAGESAGVGVSAYHIRTRNTPEYYAMGLLDQMLVQGDDSLLYQELVKKRGYTGESRAASTNWATCSITSARCCWRFR